MQERCPTSYADAGPQGCLICSEDMFCVDNPDRPPCCDLAQYKMGQVCLCLCLYLCLRVHVHVSVYVCILCTCM